MLIRHSHLPGRRAVSGRHPGPAVVLTGLCALATAAAAPAQIPVAGETVDVTVVNVDVYVIDKDGNPVTDLTEEDFQIRDAGKVVDIGFFSSIDARAPRTETEASEVTDPSATVAAGDPARIVLFVDTSESISAITGRVTSELADAIADRQPEVMVVAYDGGRLDVRQPFTADAATWRPALDGLTGGSRALITDLERRELLAEIEPILTAFAAQDSSGAFSQNSNSWAQSQARTRLDELMDSVRFFAQQEYQRNLRAVSALQGLARALEAVPGRKSLVYVGDGLSLRAGEELFNLLADGFQSFDMDRDIQARLQALRTESLEFDLSRPLRMLGGTANASRLSFYVAGSAGVRSGDRGADSPIGPRGGAQAGDALLVYRELTRANVERSLQALADTTGGRFVAPGGDTEALIDGLFADLGTYYSIGYTPPKRKRGGFREIKVKVNRKGVRLRHRRGYVLREERPGTGDRLAASLVLGYSDNLHRLELDLVDGGSAADKFLRLLIPLDALHFTDEGKGQWVSLLTVFYLGQHTDMKLTQLREVPLTIRIPEADLDRVQGEFYAAVLPLSDEEMPARVAMSVHEPNAGKQSYVRLQILSEVKTGRPPNTTAP